MCLLAASWALADDPARDWGTLHDARLVEVADGTPAVARELYEELLDDRKPTDPLHADVAYWLGRNLVIAGEVSDGSSLDALAAAATHPSLRPAAMALLVAGELLRNEVRALPAAWTFEKGTFPAVQLRPGRQEGGLSVVRSGADVVLSWQTSVRPGEPDGVGLRFARGLRVEELRFSAMAKEQDAVVRVTARDGYGLEWHTPDFALPADSWTEVVVPTRIFSREGAGLTRLERAAELLIEDLSGERSSLRGEHTLLLDDVRVR